MGDSSTIISDSLPSRLNAPPGYHRLPFFPPLGESRLSNRRSANRYFDPTNLKPTSGFPAWIIPIFMPFWCHEEVRRTGRWVVQAAQVDQCSYENSATEEYLLFSDILGLRGLVERVA